MSGTSGDGVDAAVVRIAGTGDRIHVTPRAFHTLPYTRSLRQRILDVALRGSVADVCHMNAVLGEWFARGALHVIAQAGLRPDRVDLIGSHGQTVHHLPTPIRETRIGAIRSTLQIGEPCVIAERTGITTIADFRPRDIAAGGQGAPLTPYVHYLLLRHVHRSRLIVNLGGIGNVTYLPAGKGLADIQAFDTGPANMVLDGLIHRLTDGRLAMDRHGRLAAKGTVRPALLRQLVAHPFLKKPPPKSTGREAFGAAFVDHVLQRARGDPPEDVLATCTAFTARTIGEARRWVSGSVDEVVIGGGGARNRTLMQHLIDTFAPVPVRRLDDLGWDSKAFEAIAFAVLAYQTWHAQPANVPGVTGASHPVLLGKIIPGRAWTS